MAGIKKKSRLRTSKNKKTYWRKGVQLNDVEDFLSEQRLDKREGGLFSDRKDDDLFAIDTSRQDNTKLTRRQEAALAKRQLLEQDEVVIDVKPSKRSLKRAFPKKQKITSVDPVHSANPESSQASAKEPIDLWADEEPEVIKTGQDHYDRTTRRKLPRKPSTLMHIPTLLQPVEIAQAGASYNPVPHIYESYVRKIADDEMEYEKKQEKLKKNLGLASGESYITPSEKLAEESAGLFDVEIKEENEEEPTTEKGSTENPDAESKELAKAKSQGRKSKREIQRKALEKKKKVEGKVRQTVKNNEQLVFATRKLNKEISKTLAEQEQKAKLRRKAKAMKKLLGPQKLGRGKFADVDQAFLLAEELPGSLRKLKPQGDILSERLKSFQKRNMLPVPGQRIKSTIKKKLKVKAIEKRSHKDVAPGSHLKR